MSSLTGSRSLYIGCPVRERAWILPVWKKHIDEALKLVPELDFRGYIFVAGDDDVETVSLCSTFHKTVDIIPIRESKVPKRSWTPARLEHMVGIRNLLLNRVRFRKPDLFLSLDSDILLAPEAIASMLDVMDTYGPIAVGGKTYMTSSDRCWLSYGVAAARGNYRRTEVDQAMMVDLIMAVKLMTPMAYNVDYSFHRLGEDVGWSTDVKGQGELYFDGRVASKHVMSEKCLHEIDRRVGF